MNGVCLVVSFNTLSAQYRTLKMANTSRRRESAVNVVSVANGVVNSVPDGKASVTVRSILTESMGLHTSLPPTSSN